MWNVGCDCGAVESSWCAWTAVCAMKLEAGSELRGKGFGATLRVDGDDRSNLGKASAEVKS